LLAKVGLKSADRLRKEMSLSNRSVNRTAYERRTSGQRGQTLVEYALILVLISVAVIASLQLFKSDLADIIAKIVEGLPV
jgi:Flp pilus assembly pilin Flp